MALKTLRFVQGLSRTLSLFFFDISPPYFAKTNNLEHRTSDNLEIQKPRFINKCPGFPCTPFSFANPERFKRNCFSDPSAIPFFEMRKFIKLRKPRLVILENVRGLLAPNPDTEDRSTPMDFILRGKNPSDPKQCYQDTEPNAEWGLEYLTNYGLAWDMIYSSDWGLPQSRPRVYIVMVRKDCGGQQAADYVFEVLRSCRGRLRTGAVNDFLFPDDHEWVQAAQKVWKQQADKREEPGSRKACTKFTEALMKTKREELGMAHDERPYSGAQEEGWFPHATERMVQELDVIYTIAQNQGLDMDFLLADLSQQVSRKPFRDDGNVPTLTTVCNFYSFAKHRALLGQECLWLNGFPIERMQFHAHSQRELVFLAGNAMSVPAVGAVLFGGLVAVDWGEGRLKDFCSELPDEVPCVRPDVKKLVGKAGSDVVFARCGQVVLADDDDDNAVENALAVGGDEQVAVKDEENIADDKFTT